jgi:hypothetical protein
MPIQLFPGARLYRATSANITIARSARGTGQPTDEITPTVGNRGIRANESFLLRVPVAVDPDQPDQPGRKAIPLESALNQGSGAGQELNRAYIRLDQLSLAGEPGETLDTPQPVLNVNITRQTPLAAEYLFLGQLPEAVWFLINPFKNTAQNLALSTVYRLEVEEALPAQILAITASAQGDLPEF